MDIDMKEIIKEATSEVLEDLKDGAEKYIEEEVIPAMAEAKNEFIEELKEEIKTTSSVWVKIRNALLVAAVNLGASIGAKVVDKIINAGKEESTADEADTETAENKE